MMLQSHSNRCPALTGSHATLVTDRPPRAHYVGRGCSARRSLLNMIGVVAGSAAIYHAMTGLGYAVESTSPFVTLPSLAIFHFMMVLLFWGGLNCGV
jgi:hypothetical protein